MTDFRMPSLGADMAAGTLVQWLAKPGDHVKRGDVIGVVETEKGAIEIEVFNTGIVSELVVPVGTKVPVGTVLARLDTGAAEALAPPAVVAPRAAPVSPDTAPIAAPPGTMPTVASPPQLPKAASQRVSASPAARRLAAERGLVLDRLAGSGPGGAITLADVEAASTGAPPAPLPAAPSPAAPSRPASRLGSSGDGGHQAGHYGSVLQ